MYNFNLAISMDEETGFIMNTDTIILREKRIYTENQEIWEQCKLE